MNECCKLFGQTDLVFWLTQDSTKHYHLPTRSGSMSI